MKLDLASSIATPLARKQASSEKADNDSDSGETNSDANVGDSDNEGAGAAPSSSKGTLEAPAGKKSDAEKKDTGEEGAAGEKVEVKDAETLWRVNIEAVYRRKNPKRVEKVPEIIEEYKKKGTSLAVLYAKVCKTYDLDPKVMWATRTDDEDGGQRA